MNNKEIIFLNIDYKKVNSFSIHENGIQIIEDDETIDIYNDVFRTIPLYIVKTMENIYLFSNFKDILELENINKEIDSVGFWEVILFNLSLNTRTLFKNIKQMPSASKLTINKKNLTYSIKRYWDFNVKQDTTIKTLKDAQEKLFSILDNSYSKIDLSKKYITGISGGMDSRINLAFLSRYLKKDKLNLFTYGFDKEIYEYKFAIKVAEELGYNNPYFHKLSYKTYKDSLDYLPLYSGGQIGINHSPLFSYLQSINKKETTLISTSYSEIIFSLKTEKNNQNVVLSFENKLNYTNNIPTEIKKEIYNDINIIKDEYTKTNSYTNINEFLYQSEQHPKFHENLTYCFSNKIDIFNPFTNYDLLTLVMSIPKEFKFRKQLQDSILKNYFNINQKNVSSSRFEWGDAGSRIDWYRFKFLNTLNAILRKTTDGRFEFINKYQTEEQHRIFTRYFKTELNDALDKFQNQQLISEEVVNLYKTSNLRDKRLSEKFNLVSLNNFFEQLDKK